MNLVLRLYFTEFTNIHLEIEHKFMKHFSDLHCSWQVLTEIRKFHDHHLKEVLVSGTDSFSQHIFCIQLTLEENSIFSYSTQEVSKEILWLRLNVGHYFFSKSLCSLLSGCSTIRKKVTESVNDTPRNET